MRLHQPPRPDFPWGHPIHAITLALAFASRSFNLTSLSFNLNSFSLSCSSKILFFALRTLSAWISSCCRLTNSERRLPAFVSRLNTNQAFNLLSSGDFLGGCVNQSKNFAARRLCLIGFTSREIMIFCPVGASSTSVPLKLSSL